MKKKYSLFLILIIIINFSFSQEVEWEWVKQIGGLHDQSSMSIELDDQGNTYITGSFGYEIIFENDTLISQGEYDAYLAKYDSSGNLQWVNQIGGAASDNGYDIAFDNIGNVYLTGSIGGFGFAFIGDTSVYANGNTDIFLAKFNNSGDLLWVETAGGNYFSENSSNWDCGRSVSTDSENNVYITGSFIDTAYVENDTLFSYGGIDVFVAKYDENGELIWADNYGSAQTDNGSVIIIDNSDNLYIEGWFEDTISIADTVLILQDGMDNFLAKLNSDGEMIWIKTMGGSSAYIYYTSLALDNENNLYVSDYFSGTININDTAITANQNIDFYLSKYDPNGTFQWIKQYFDVVNVLCYSLSIDANKNLYLTGSFTGELSFQNNVLLYPYGYSDIFMSKFDENGDFIWIISAGGIMNEMGRDVISNHDDLYITGSFNDEVVFGNTSLISNSRDAYIAKIKDLTLEINQIENEIFLSVFPNPNNGNFSLQANGVNQGYFKIRNINGQILLKRELNDIVEPINISNYPPGVYFVTIRTKNLAKTEKIIIH